MLETHMKTNKQANKFFLKNHLDPAHISQISNKIRAWHGIHPHTHKNVLNWKEGSAEMGSWNIELATEWEWVMREGTHSPRSKPRTRRRGGGFFRGSV